MKIEKSSVYINEQRKQYSLYVLQSRAIPAITDGLKAGGRRALWTGRDGHKWKTANLAGSTMPIHPHSECSGAINTLTAPYGNNITLFKGDGAFGTLINPTAYGASRYTSVTVSKFTQDVIFKDIEIIPMMENYDGTLQEPVHFLPLVPIALLNPAEGIAVGYSTNILPRALDDIIEAQLAHLKGTFLSGKRQAAAMMPHFTPLKNKAYTSEVTDTGIAYYFNGDIVRHDMTNLTITKLPYGQTHKKVIAKLDDLMEKDTIQDYTDKSKDVINIEVKFKRGQLKDLDDIVLFRLLGITVRHIENLNVLDFTGSAIWNTTPLDAICKFTDWRFGYYTARYQRLLDIVVADMQRYIDIRNAIKNNIAGFAKKTQSRAELKELLFDMGIVNIDYIADLPVYRFTQDEHVKNEERIKEAQNTMDNYKHLLSSDSERKKVYISELQEVLTNYNKGKYERS
jgi:DNA gyrase/topoisomerase IV subunit A